MADQFDATFVKQLAAELQQNLTEDQRDLLITLLNEAPSAAADEPPAFPGAPRAGGAQVSGLDSALRCADRIGADTMYGAQPRPKRASELDAAGHAALEKMFPNFNKVRGL